MRCSLNMNRVKIIGLMLLCVLSEHPAVSLAASGLSASSTSATDTNVIGAFVQDFYDWYAPIANSQKNSLPWEGAITIKRDLFSRKLALALNVDKHSFANPDGTYTELDFDPFLNTYNPCEHYIVGNILEYDNNYRAAIQPVCNGKLQSKPVVFAEVTLKKGHWGKPDHWEFSDFYYPEGQDLFQLLKRLRKQRSDDLD